MEQGLYKIFEKNPVDEADIKLLYDEIWAKGNVQSDCSAEDTHIEVDDEKVAKTDMKKRRDALCNCWNSCPVNSLQKALCAVELDEAEPTWDSPNAVVSCNFRNRSILAQAD